MNETDSRENMPRKALLCAAWIILEITIITVEGQSGDDKMIMTDQSGDQSGDQEIILNQLTDQTNEGNEFFVGFIRNQFGRIDEHEMIPPVLWITTKESTPVNFDIFTIAGLLASNSTAPRHVTYIPIPLEFVVFNSSEDSISDSQFKGIQIKAEGNRKIIVFGQHEKGAPSDAYLALPIILVPVGRSYEYIAASLRDIFPRGVGSLALIIGTEDDTEIILEPSVLIWSPFAPAVTNRLFIPGDSVQFCNITIQRFQTFYLQADRDISGTRIIANKPISVFSGHDCARTRRRCDVLIEQIQPIDTWGTEVVTIPLRTRRGNFIKVFASQDSTTVSVTCTNIVNGTVTSDRSFTLNRNGFRRLYNIEDFSLIQSNYQIGVFQFSRFRFNRISDLFMLSVPSREQYRNSYVVAPAPFDPSIEGTVPGRVAYVVNYTNIAIPAKYFNASLITINNNVINASEFRPIKRADNSIWGYGAQLLLDEGAQVMKHKDPNSTFSVTMYGFSNQMSWGCTGGTGLAPIALISSVTVTALNPQAVGHLLIVDCSSDISDVSNTENQIVGQSLILRCRVNTVRPITNLTFVWSSGNVILRMINQIGQTQDHYIISQLNTSNEGQVYKCDVMVNTIPPVTASDTTVLDLTVTTFSVTVSSFNSLQEIMVGNSQDIQCTVVVDFNGVEPDSVIFNWLGPESVSIANDSRVVISLTNSSINTFVSTLQFSYLMEGDEGRYTCNAMILKTIGSSSTELGRLNVPTPNVSITVHNDMIVGQPFSLECIITTVRGINSQVNIIWSRGNDGEERTRENVNASITISSVMYRDYFNISQLTTDENGETYRCEVMINANPSVIANDSYTLHVIVPEFSVSTSPTEFVEGAMVGNNQTIQCTISTVSGVTLNSVMVNWIRPNGTSITNSSRIKISLELLSGNNSTNIFSSSLIFIYLMEGDDGIYMCNVSILHTNASTAVEVGTLIVPTPTVNVTIQTNQTAGEPLTLYCMVITVRGITSTVDIMWLVDDLMLEIADVNISLTSDDMQLYVTSYTIDQLSATDNERIYQCKVLINALVMASDNFTLNVTGTNNISDRSTFSWMIMGISVGVILLIVIIIILLCLVILRKRRLKYKTLSMKAAELNLHPLNNPSYIASIKSIAGISEQISTEEWKKELAGYLIDYSSLDIKDIIASGKFGVVYKAYYTSKENTITEVAVKTVKYFSSQTAENFIKECNIANKFDHPNVLNLIGVCIVPEEAVPLMVMPYMLHGDIRSFVKSKRENNITVEEFPPGLSEELLTKMCLDIAKGMEYLAIRHFVHRDLAARNCMLDQSMTVKVADFGLSRDVYVTEYYTMSQSIPLPVKWLAPEALFDRHFNEKTDVWAFGVTCWEVFSLGLQPYPLIGPSEIGDYIKSGKILDKPQLSSDEMYEIMKSCWKFQADERANFSDLVKAIDHLNDTPQNKVFIKKASTAYLPVYS